ncbi:tRNA (adenosine(37)-N6)-threonylcarbamoyltransferase complex transferase subunit TsaD [Patescibacteria group bacterium]|nr:tRNA (adenosine(37)-N6)-threonylcarbamoyltransferase complex transferase subunit TsaD [Patescibacteria group bacterium]MBU1016062.1 tRNA (adenosine(37)-N6)-threonylcarbamoyltransferase complex transferase subunit TsaD [Patescibacteria group bacterium]MBU1685468.1 tRNA (adenosine(37)-N6)-threonylcarbamoyltransferase complex transferase subunit TsaD [Patescibacteria group bacterium]MBU1938680.1 tRNA (adenosine(37)-N6)-threonylcarbamoyltransferase complex transferase subunit TsaD [Patescibacteri
MKIFGIETSCDETAAAVVEDGVKVLSNVIASSVDLHQATGGVVPEVAAREHLRQISPVIDRALLDAGCEWKDIGAIAVTTNPGLIASLLVGINTAQTIVYIHQKPLIEVDHVIGHIYANFLERKTPPKFPLLVLTVSGGHNELMLMRGHHDFVKLGETLDDAAGEAFDKVARLLGLGYPGGPVISRLAEKGDPAAFQFPRPMLDGENKLNFSFSGLKSAVRREVEQLKKIDDQTIADLCAGFQQAVIEVLADKLVLAAQEHEVKEVHLAGGVSANRLLRQMAREKLPDSLPLYWPAQQIYCTDNAAMIAAAAHFQSE